MGGLAAAALLVGRRRLPEGDAPLRRLGWMLLAQAVLFGGLTLAVRFPQLLG